MDYKLLDVRLIFFSLIIFTLLGCREKEKRDISNIYYIEMVNFKDTLEKYVSKSIFGKVSFIKNEKQELVSVNYVTEEYPDMHYYKSITEIGNTIKPGSKKIRIEVAGNYTTDSAMYSLQKYKYINNKWEKTSDMGFIKAAATSSSSKELEIMGLGNQIITNMISYTN